MATDVCVKIGRKIRVLRTERGWSQAMLADNAEVAREHLSELENGHKEIGARTLERITKALKVSLAQFFDGM
jgi:transcriptional regulator with XRE-family HTH domain